MERHIFLSVAIFSLLAVAIGIFVMPGKPPQAAHLPWQIEINANGNSHVYGVEIGRTTLAEAESQFREPAEVSLFEAADGKRVVEAYFNSVDISGLRARIILVMALNKAQLDKMYKRGERLANMGGGRHKVTLAEVDLQSLRQTAFSSLSYIPKLNLDAELITKRFGEPAEKIAEQDGRIEHWLYPARGLDIALNAEGKEVLQYVRPSDFALVRTPLIAAGR